MPTIELSGDEALLRGLQRVDDFNSLRAPAVRSMARLRAILGHYPPPPPDSTYTRTGRLGRSWTEAVETSPSEIRAVLGNNTTYAPYVHASGPVAVRGSVIEGQARVHQGRWPTDQQAIDDVEDAVRRDFEDTIRGLVDF